MSEEKVDVLSRNYTIPLDRVMISPRHKRAKKAISVIREFAGKHMKSQEIQISPELNLILWARGIRNPPKRVKVKMERDADGVVSITPLIEVINQEDKETNKEIQKTPKND
jgi:large subunit ribosomal protein L31e